MCCGPWGRRESDTKQQHHPRMEAGPSLWLEGRTSHPPPNLQKVRDWRSVANNGQWFTQSWLCTETSIKTLRNRFLRASGLVNSWRLGKSSILRGGGHSWPFPHSLPVHLCHLALPELHSFKYIHIYLFIQAAQVLGAVRGLFDLHWDIQDFQLGHVGFFIFPAAHRNLSCGIQMLSCGMWDLCSLTRDWT